MLFRFYLYFSQEIWITQPSTYKLLNPEPCFFVFNTNAGVIFLLSKKIPLLLVFGKQIIAPGKHYGRPKILHFKGWEYLNQKYLFPLKNEHFWVFANLKGMLGVSCSNKIVHFRSRTWLFYGTDTCSHMLVLDKTCE